MANISNLNGKKIMLVHDRGERIHARDIIEKLEAAGATVVDSSVGIIRDPSLETINAEIDAQNPKVDALLIFNPNIGLRARRHSLTELLRRNNLPAAIADHHEKLDEFSGALRSFNTKYFDLLSDDDHIYDKVVYGISDAIANKAKPGHGAVLS